MSTAPNSLTVTFIIKDRFKASTPDEKAMMIQIARLCVLYQDIMLELDGALNEDPRVSSVEDTNFRRFYFVRRALGSAWETKQAVDVLNQNRAFKTLKKQMMKEVLKPWNEAVKFFQANQRELRAFRNDYGGHFGDAAAKHAIENLPSKLKGSAVVYPTKKGAGLKMSFAGQVFAVGLTKDRKATEDFKQFFTRAFTLMQQANHHAINVGHIIADQFFLPKS